VQRWQGLADVPEGWGRSVVAIGVFDGVHLGHRRIVSAALAAGHRFGLPVVVVTFDPHPSEVIRPGSHPPLLCTVARRAQLLAGLGVDAVCVLAFTPEFSRLAPDEFVRSVLAERLHARWVVVGENFRFGHRAKGDVALLNELGEKYDFGAEGVPLLAEGPVAKAGGANRSGEGEGEGTPATAGVTVSSSAIRDHLAAGDVAAAARDLGRPHRLEGVVVRGEQRGRALGFPTANLATTPQAAIPADGVYAGWLAVLADEPDGHGQDRDSPAADSPGTREAAAVGSSSAGGPGAGSAAAESQEAERWPAAISVGTNPTFDGRQQVVEAYALDRDDLDLYGKRVAVDFAARLRGMEKFDSVDTLIEQMRRDVDRARQLVGRAVA
jgi:riboflavin kinase/FMN adenylyltransferase